MTTTASAFLLLAMIVAVAYVIYEHRQRTTTPLDARGTPDMMGVPVSSSMMPGDLVGPGATGNSGWYELPAPRVMGA
jgi:hypothetical protein